MVSPYWLDCDQLVPGILLSPDSQLCDTDECFCARLFTFYVVLSIRTEPLFQALQILCKYCLSEMSETKMIQSSDPPHPTPWDFGIFACIKNEVFWGWNPSLSMRFICVSHIPCIPNPAVIYSIFTYPSISRSDGIFSVCDRCVLGKIHFPHLFEFQVFD